MRMEEREGASMTRTGEIELDGLVAEQMISVIKHRERTSTAALL